MTKLRWRSLLAAFPYVLLLVALFVLIREFSGLKWHQLTDEMSFPAQWDPKLGIHVT